ncbi:MAG: glycosyltransferase family 4 protein [Candidatus Ancaeobacter aquaticus]|nr:glycosyltransferase family 4 protein [Candidatus Ancaeobacter aquaticus]
MPNNNKIKVLHIITRLVHGGAQENTLYTVKLLDKTRYDVSLVSGPSDGDEGSLEHIITDDNEIEFTVINELIRSPAPIKDFIALYKLFHLMRKNKYDIIHTHSSKAGILGRFAAKLAGIPIIIHTPHGHIFYGYFSAFITNIFIIFERITALFTDKIITLTHRGTEEHVMMNIAPADKFVTIYSGINIRKDPFSIDINKKKQELNIAKETLVIGNIARLADIKGQKYLIEAMPEICSKVPNCCLILVGDGPAKNELLQVVHNLDIVNKVLFLGLRTDIAELISIMDIFILPSLNEGMGKVLLQSQHLGKPIIATDVGGVREIVTNGVNGFLVTSRDSGSIAQRSIELLKSDAMRTKMGDAGRANVGERFSIETMVKNIASLYEELLHTKLHK